MPNQVAVIMGSTSDWDTLKAATEMLTDLGVTWDAEVVSAHRTPEKLFDFARTAADKGYQVIIAGAGGAAHLPGMVASSTALPVLGVPVKSRTLNGMDSLLSIVQMPKGVAVGTLAIGAAGAANAGLLAGQIIALNDPAVAEKVNEFRSAQTEKVMNDTLPGQDA